MFDLLLIVFTVALLVFSYILRTLLAIRLPAELRLKPTRLEQPPDIMSDLFQQADRELSQLGFNPGHWASVQITPKLPGFAPPLVRLYHHQHEPVVARVSPPFNLFAGDHCQVLFLSLNEQRTFLASANRQPDLFPQPPQDLAIANQTQLDTLSEQFQSHLQAMSCVDTSSWLDRRQEKGEAAWALHLANRYEKRGLQWAAREGYIKPQADGSAVPTLAVVLGFLWRFLTGREKNPPRESSPIPAERAAYLFRNWQQGQQQPPPLSTQLGLFVISALAFAVLAGAFWNWTFGLILLFVIGFHEAGHWLAMHLLGFRNLQILMLPLVGGVTLGQESEHRASHRILVSLMGPLPGILLGFILLALFGLDSGWLFELSLTLLLVNYFNLLPVLPLDGGQIVKSLIPARGFGLMVALEWLGAGALLLSGWWLDSLFLAILAILPILSSLSLLKRKQVIELLDSPIVESGIVRTGANREIASIIEALDLTDKLYRPLEKKAQEINEILSTLKLRPASARNRGMLLAIYLLAFALPPAGLFALSPDFRHVVQLLGSPDHIQAEQEAYERALQLPMPQLLKQLAKNSERLSLLFPSRPSQSVLGQPASLAEISDTEARLGTSIAGEHRKFLLVSNGYRNLWTEEGKSHYQLLPVEQVKRFGRLAPEIASRIHEYAGLDGPLQVSIYPEPPDEQTEAIPLTFEQLGDMLLIGRRNDGTYLLQEANARSDGSAPVLLLHETIEGLSGSRYQSLRHYLADNLAKLEMVSP